MSSTGARRQRTKLELLTERGNKPAAALPVDSLQLDFEARCPIFPDRRGLEITSWDPNRFSGFQHAVGCQSQAYNGGRKGELEAFLPKAP